MSMRIMRFKSLYLYKWLPHGYRWKRIVNVSISHDSVQKRNTAPESSSVSRSWRVSYRDILSVDAIVLPWVLHYSWPHITGRAEESTRIRRSLVPNTGATPLIYCWSVIHGLTLPKGSLSGWMSSEDPWACLNKRMFQYDSRPRSTDRLSRDSDVTKKRGRTQTEIRHTPTGGSVRVK